MKRLFFIIMLATSLLFSVSSRAEIIYLLGDSAFSPLPDLNPLSFGGAQVTSDYMHLNINNFLSANFAPTPAWPWI